MSIPFNDLPFSSEELEFFKGQMKQYKVPRIYKIVMGTLYKYAKYFYPIIFLLIIILALIHSFSNIDLFPLIKGISLIVIFGTLIPLTIAWIWNQIKTYKAYKKLGLTRYQWYKLVSIFNLTF